MLTSSAVSSPRDSQSRPARDAIETETQFSGRRPSSHMKLRVNAWLPEVEIHSRWSTKQHLEMQHGSNKIHVVITNKMLKEQTTKLSRIVAVSRPTKQEGKATWTQINLILTDVYNCWSLSTSDRDKENQPCAPSQDNISDPFVESVLIRNE